ncbi:MULTISPECIES: glyoxylate/hydroxypyruvate reductase A [unclassified Caballeronia]|uniref:2-hydroxyacid dehydrogenase n=1 Tax=unclassified Caballeronia TaxID=2646786 RepID=UPI0028664FE8|nr:MULTISPECIES: glyoxylate/hydroxypyruvate reductase A [unclassified Caballeronia]MDR5770280.1 glyoxylate/hydroxypyruvate reductase A [Caballeronia sp. LZ002]MDR5845717.1 glyoxylate/hydroxypyruvate reductase A [Caballeronia sp. LZ003]
MKIIFYEEHADTDAWLGGLRRELPDADLRIWQPGDTAPADYAIVWRAPRELFANRPELKAIFNLGAGVDAILDVERKEPGTLPPNATLVRLEDTGMAQQMVEYSTYAVLRYLRRFDEYEALQREGRWQKLTQHARASFTVGVLGLGVLGGEVARGLLELGVPVRGYSRTAKTIEGVEVYAGPERFDAFLDGVHVLVNLLPHTPDTEGILNARTFSKLARGAYLVNVARGPHLVDDDLLAALDSGQLAAATLDVFHVEPLAKEHPFWKHPRVSVTPHISAETLREESIVQIAAKIKALSRGETIGGIVDFSRGY